jgi:hypothetical protein
VPDFRVTLVRGSDAGHGPLPTGPRRITGIKAFFLFLLLASLLVGFLIAAFVLGSLVAAGILLLAAVATIAAIVRSGFRRLTRS